ncbi:MAG: AmmeMemoRadiSam system radical SAM enzyme [marine bacterium B5-7]|nr:MAG: AmmeMemoRadiSam system radical SAM enzyme [marine bacterium B5-7]
MSNIPAVETTSRELPSTYQLVPTRLQEKLDDGTTRCNLCPWRCRLRHGQRGFCQAHVNRNGTLYNLSYGIVSSIDIGVIEDKPVRHYQPGTKVMSVGGYGCSFRCTGCHNLEISWGEAELDRLARGRSTQPFVTPESIVEAAIRHGCQGIAFTYSEPVIWMEYVLDVCAVAHDKGLYTVYVSNSFVTHEALDCLVGSVDVLCSDIKSMEDSFYKSICGKAGVADVLDSLEYADSLGFHVETRTNIIPTRNDGLDNIARAAHWIRDHLGADSPWHLTRFFPAYQLSHLPATPVDLLYRAEKVARAAGLTNVYVYADQGCDCATENLPVSVFLDDSVESISAVKKCTASCCGDEGVLLKKYEEGRP